jgi:hypothetical protein
MGKCLVDVYMEVKNFALMDRQGAEPVARTALSGAARMPPLIPVVELGCEELSIFVNLMVWRLRKLTVYFRTVTRL